jgi:hypothetical protein
MMTIASTARSSRAGAATEISVTEYRRSAASVAMASAVWLLAKVESIGVTTPMARKAPRFNARAALLGW